ncbi:MAG: SpoIIE family protein phosphatase [Gammaproteobacteria bacterium]
MLLRTRLTLVFALAAGVLLTVFIGAVVAWRYAEQGRFRELVLDTQQIGWNRIEAATLERLRLAAVDLASDPALLRALAGRDVDTVPTLTDHGLGDAAVGVFDAVGRAVYTSADALEQELPLDASGVQRVLREGREVTGLMPTGSEAFSFVAAVPVRRRGTVIGGVTLSLPVGPGLEELSQGMGRAVALVDLRGRAVSGNGAALYNLLEPELLLRRSGTTQAAHLGRDYRIATIAAPGHDGRQVGAFVTLQDVSLEVRRERYWLLGTSSISLLLVAAVLARLFTHLRRSFGSLARAVEVLTALSRGETSVRLDAHELDESGQIAAGVERLRGEMLNLQILREERQRERWRQEVLIRDELRALAGTLEGADRDEILADLATALAGEDGVEEGTNQLGVLAFVLGRLAARIRGQQERLRGLIGDLQDALRTREAFVALQQELEIARRMQLSVLPRHFPERADLSLATFILPAKEVGGDFYDYFTLGDGRLGILIADVSGKGVPAAFFMAICQTLLKASARFVDSPAGTLARVNAVLSAENDEMMFVTVFYGVLDPGTGRLVYASGGHNPPALRTRSGAKLLAQPGGMALAVADNVQFVEGSLTLEPGDVLFLYTDGITEARSASGALFGEAALLAALDGMAGDAPAQAYTAGVVQAVQSFAGSAPQADDITCVALRYSGPARSAPANTECEQPSAAGSPRTFGARAVTETVVRVSRTDP